MPVVVVTTRQLALRTLSIRKMLRPISRVPDGPACAGRYVRGDHIIGAFDAGPPLSPPREWRFPTFVPGLTAAYYETWRKVDRDSWHLMQAYLNVYRLEFATARERDFMSLHCDPGDDSVARHAAYRRTPHVHVGAAEYPFPRAHLCVTGADVGQVLASEGSLCGALEWAIAMLRDEVLAAMVPWTSTS
jgi:hypothetical protein